MLTLALFGCAKNPATGGVDMVFMTEEEEFEIGHDVARNAIKTHGLYKENDAFVKYYKEISRNLVDVTERAEMPFEFIVLDSGQFNAWATPGYINIYRGIIPFMNSESEFAAVMAHEAGHVAARHTVRKDAARKAGSALLFVGAALIGANTDNKAVAYGALGAGLFATQVGFAKYSRAYEDEADELALRYMRSMGYDPKEAVGMYQTMGYYNDLRTTIYKYFNDGEEPKESMYYDLLASHPNPDDRVEQVIKREGSLPQGYVSENRDRFLAKIDGMAFGPNFRQYGVVGERNLYNPDNRMVGTLPEGFLTMYMGDGWRSYNNVYKAEASFYKKRVSKGEDPEETLRVMYPKLRQLQKLELDGFEAYTGTQKWVKRGTWGKLETLGMQRVFGFKVLQDKRDDVEKGSSGRDFYILSFFTPEEHFENLDQQFFKSAESFQRLSRKDADRIEPLRVKIYTVQKGDTVKSLAAKLPFGDLKESWFRALNGLGQYDAVKVGHKVKLIVDPNLKILQ